MLSFLRPPHPPRTNNALNNPIYYEKGTSSVEWHSPDSGYIMTHTIPPTSPTEGPSIVAPPFHYHVYQTEHFRIQSGTGAFYRGIDPTPFAILSSKSGAKRTATVQAGRYHRFENTQTDENLVLDIQLDPESYENEQRFFRNFFGYLDDCKQAKVSPSLFQLLVFLHSADTPLALPLPSERLGVMVSWLFCFLMSLYGKWMLGYAETYPEYYVEKKTE